MSFIPKAPLIVVFISSVAELLLGGESKKLCLQFSSWKAIREPERVLSYLVITRVAQMNTFQL